MDMNNVSHVIKRRKKELGAEIKKRGRGGFSQLTKELDISKGALWKFVNTDYIPTSPILLRKLTLPEPIVIYRMRNPDGTFK